MISQKSFNSFTSAAKSLRGELSGTPKEIVVEMFNKLNDVDWKNPELKILDPCAGFGTFLREAYIKLKEFHTKEHILNNMLYACEIGSFKPLFLQKKMGLRNIYKGDFLSMKKIDNWPDKFDIVIANPPYSARLDLKFLKKASEICDGEIVFVHPSTYVVDRKKITSIFQEGRDMVKERLTSLELFNGNGLFNIELQVPCSITHLGPSQKSKNTFELINRFDNSVKVLSKDDIENLSVFGYDENYISIFKKVLSQISTNGHLEDFGTVNGNKVKNKELTNSESYFVEFSRIMGRAEKGENLLANSPLYKKDFFTAISKNKLEVKNGTTPEYDIWFEFTTPEEANNFLKYLQTDFFRMCLALSKISQQLARRELTKTPWMDFTQEWTDEKLYAHFSITEEEQAFIKEVIPPYYD